MRFSQVAVAAILALVTSAAPVEEIPTTGTVVSSPTGPAYIAPIPANHPHRPLVMLTGDVSDSVDTGVEAGSVEAGGLRSSCRQCHFSQEWGAVQPSTLCCLCYTESYPHSKQTCLQANDKLLNRNGKIYYGGGGFVQSCPEFDLMADNGGYMRYKCKNDAGKVASQWSEFILNQYITNKNGVMTWDPVPGAEAVDTAENADIVQRDEITETAYIESTPTGPVPVAGPVREKNPDEIVTFSTGDGLLPDSGSEQGGAYTSCSWCVFERGSRTKMCCVCRKDNWTWKNSGTCVDLNDRLHNDNGIVHYGGGGFARTCPDIKLTYSTGSWISYRCQDNRFIVPGYRLNFDLGRHLTNKDGDLVWDLF